jgi:predicted nuclease of predicted toxin-antitoxin system
MKFLIDENLSEVLVTALSDLAPGSIHVRAARAMFGSGRWLLPVVSRS